MVGYSGTLGRRGLAVAVALVAVGFTGCTGATDDVASDPTSSPVAPSPRPVGALEKVLGYDAAFGSAGDIVAEAVWQENQVAACLKAQGFSYWPEVPSVNDIEITQGLEWGSREFAEEYGFGLVRSPEEGTGTSWSYSTTESPEETAYLADMTEAELEAYNEALFGPVVEPDGSVVVHDESGAPDDAVYREGGCLDQVATGEITDDVALVREAATAFLQSAAEDTAFDSLNAEWSSCLAEAGYRAATPELLRSDLEAEFIALSTPEQLSYAELEPFAERELAVALADLECREAVDLEARRLVIYHQLQQDYVDAHRGELDLLERAIAAAEQDHAAG